MSLTLIDKLYTQAKKASQEDVGKITSNLLDIIHVPDKAAESMALLRQLYFILQAKDADTSLPKQLIIRMIDSVIGSEKGSIKECLLCQRILQDLLPLSSDYDSHTAKMMEKIPSILHLQMYKNVGCISKLFNNAIRWLQTQDLEFEVQRKAFSFLIAVSLLHSDQLITGKVKSVNEKLGSWLMDASLYQAPNPYSSNPFRKDQKNMVTEIDGAPSNNFFTILSIGQYYTDDQLANIFCYSMLYQWIKHSYDALSSQETDVLEEGIQSELEVSGGFEPSQPWLIDSMSNKSSRSTTPTKRPVSMPAAVGWVSSPKTISEKQALQRMSSAGQVKQSSWVPRATTPSSQSSRESTPTGSLSSLTSAGQAVGLTSPEIEQREKTLTDSLRSSTSELSGSVSPTKPQRSLTPSSVLRAFSPASVLEENSSGQERSNVIKKVYESLVGRTIDYCFRLLDQCDRKPKVPTDAELQNACLLETVKLLDLICKIDKGQVPKTFRELKRLVTMTTHDNNNPRLLIVILHFLLNHSKAVAYDPSEELKVLFHRVLAHNLTSVSVCFDIVMFILDNLETLTHEHNIMATYFPNMFKLLAWHPHTFVSDFDDIVPAMMSQVTSLEVFHALIDLPCMTVSLDIMEKTKHMDFTTVAAVTEQEPTRAMDAFKNAMFRPMFNFFTRAEGGHGDTINRLDQFHTGIQDMMEHPRVLVCYQVVPVLLRCWFDVIYEEGDQEFVQELVPVLIERTGLLYGIPEYQNDVKRIISENIILLLKKYPQVVFEQKSEIIEYLSSTRNIDGRENFFSQLVWAVGEYTSTTYSSNCGADTVRQMYEMLELLTYEVISITGSVPASQAPYTVKLVSTLMSAMSKLASRCQDLIPRAILCLTKVAKQHKADVLEKVEREILLTRAQELINLLKLPNFASIILNPPQGLETSRCHRDRSSMSTILRATHRMVAPTL
ncbi:AP-5 complex subunit zeta-1-like [Ruditapes philippinarum]|uniref:AP-5 complex subunit zeta-1-like n=1 Tax=Ruditapes philippinarum TaxID=129788 RepID=UPI00295AD461|nr:AP-5 complex subunit zeta-1-like [Ruditapes philippinarum]